MIGIKRKLEVNNELDSARKRIKVCDETLEGKIKTLSLTTTSHKQQQVILKLQMKQTAHVATCATQVAKKKLLRKAKTSNGDYCMKCDLVNFSQTGEYAVQTCTQCDVKLCAKCMPHWYRPVNATKQSIHIGFGNYGNYYTIRSKFRNRKFCLSCATKTDCNMLCKV